MNIKIQIILTLLALFLWEHIAYTNESQIAPTWVIKKVTIIAEWMFYQIGIMFGYIGSLVTYLHLDKMIDTILHILNTCYDLVLSIKYIEKGIHYVASLFNDFWKVFNTSLALVLIAMTIIVGIIIEVTTKRIRRKYFVS